MRKGMKRIHLLVCLIILVGCLTAQTHNVLAATVHVIAGKGVPQVLANEFGSITTQVMDFYQEIYNYAPVNSISVIIVADEPDYAQRLQLEGYSKEQAMRTAKVSSGMFLNAKFSASSKIATIYTYSAGKLQYSNPTIIICADKSPTYLSRIRTVTHEMFHQMQWELRGNTQAHAWLIEGSAKVSEFVLLEWLGKGSLASHRQIITNSLVNVKHKADPNDVKNGGPSWLKLMEENKYPYEVSESMTDYLMRQVDKPLVVRYFALSGETGDRNIAFRKAFGMSYTQFIDDYKAYMKQETAAAGQLKFAVEGAVAPEVVQTISKNGASIEQMLRSQGWTMTKPQFFILVPSTEVMLNVMRRESPQTDEGRLADIARRSIIASIGEQDYVYDIGKAMVYYRDFTPLAFLTVCRNSLIATAQPVSATSIYWFYEGTAQFLTAMAVEATGGKSVADARKEWIITIGKAAEYPPLTQMNKSLTVTNSCYRGEVICATAALAVGYLAEKTNPGALLRYFTVLRDLNDGPRAFQQVFGMSLEAFAADFAAYLNAQKRNND